MKSPAPLQRETALGVLRLHVGLADSLTDFAPLPTGLYNENARLVAGGRPFVLKKLPPGRPLARHRFAVGFQARLAGAGFPCPRVIANAEGEFITPFAGGLWTLQDWAPGRHLDLHQRGEFLTAGGAHTLGGLVGRLHRTAPGLAQEGQLPPAEAPLNLPDLLAGTLQAAAGFLRATGLRPSQAFRLRLKPGKSSLEKEVCRWLPALKAAVDILSTWEGAGDPALAATGPCHADVNWENLLFDDDGGVILLDFDNAAVLPMAHDAAAACAVICGAETIWQASFAAGYQAESGQPFPGKDLAYLMLLKYSRSLLWQIRGRHEATDQDMARTWVAFLGGNMEKTLAGLAT